jgi:hypothetical protein
MFPEYGGNELEESDYVEWTGLCAGRLAVEEEVEEFETDRVSLSI